MPIILKNLTNPHKLQLIIGNRNESSWSLRAWLMVQQSNLTCETKLIPFVKDYATNALGDYKPARSVPILVDNGLVVGQSVAIGLHIHQLSPNSGIIPADKNIAAIAFDLSCEMISSFQNLRQQCPMNLQLDKPDFVANDVVLADLARLELIWQSANERAKKHLTAKGDFLLGDYSIVDAMFTPVATRIQTYHLPVGAFARQYCDNLLNHKWFQEWQKLALLENYEYPW